MKAVLPLLFILLGLPLFAQEGSPAAVRYLQALAPELGLTPTDVLELRVADRYASPDGTEHVYVRQSLYGTPIHNAIASVHYRDGRAVHHTSSLEARIRERGRATVPSLTGEQAYLRLGAPVGTRLLETELVYYPLPTSAQLQLAWQLVTEDDTTSTLYLVAADSGEELYRRSLTLSCNFATGGGAAGGSSFSGKKQHPQATRLGDGSLYNVFPFGLDSPLDGPRQLVAEPADELASPYGWHDTDGEPGPEYTITRGNNVYAYRDADTSNNKPDPDFVVDGGPELDFDFYYAPDERTDTVAAASVTQLFYLTNMMHDFTYRHGFDEAAGNFQQNNYGRGGKGNDIVYAEAQDASDSNNANFSTRGDGRSARIQMFLWEEGSQLTVLTPEDLAGNRRTGRANFGPDITEVPVTAALAIARDSTDQPTRGCFALVNPEEVAGKIVLIDRGDCTFQQKVYNAEQAGAVGVIICNPENTILNMAAAGNAGELPVTIPSVLTTERDCTPLKQVMATGGTVTASLQDNDARPVDGAFDNGVIAHEYGHGVSIRLVGGPSEYRCLFNDEQMGEGWSDFFTLATTPQAETQQPTGAERRGIGRYVSAGEPGSRGIRSQYYTTDYSINNRSYDFIITTRGEHRLGELWAATLWDIYWAMVDAYGFDEDVVTGSGGNNAAVRLIIEGMKYTRCEPGFVDGRDGILAADRALNDGANQCLLWKVFQRRGLGPTAVQGSSDARNDNQEAFDLPLACTATVKLLKTVDSTYVSAGNALTYTLTVRNDTEEAVNELTVTDRLAPGTRLATVPTVTDAYLLSGDRLDWRIDALAAGESLSLSYTVTTDPGTKSERMFYSGVEADTAVWDSVSNTGTVGWTRTDSLAFAGQYAWYVPNVGSRQDQLLQFRDPVRITGDRPVLRFFTRYDTEPAYDAGVVQISTDGSNWQELDQHFLRADYRGAVAGTSPLRNLSAFWGDSRGYREVIIDLSGYRGQSVYLRWRFVSDEDGGASGWWIDEVEVLDLVTYEEEAVLLIDDQGIDTASVPTLGVVVNAADVVSGLFDLTRSVTNAVRVYPNPASDRVQLRWEAAGPGPARVELFALGGQRVRSRTLAAGSGAAELSLTGLPPGQYTLRITEAAGASTAKLTVR